MLALAATCLAAGLTAQAGPVKRTASNVLYVANNDPATGKNTILAYRRDPATGFLTQFASYPTGGTGSANPLGLLGVNDGDRDMIISPDRSLLFSVNAGSNDISVFQVSSDGTLSAANGSPFPSGGSFPSGLALVGDVLYVNNMNAALTPAGFPGDPSGGQSNVTAFRVSGSGHLSAVPHSTIVIAGPPAVDASSIPIPIPPFNATGQSPTSVVASPDGKFLFGTALFGNKINAFKLENNGRPTLIASVTPAVTNPPPPAWVGFVLPSVIPGIVTPNLNLPLNSTVHPTQPILYVNEVTYTSIGVYTWDGSGALTHVTSVVNAGPGFPVPGFAPCWNRVSPDGAFLYVMNGLTNSVTAFSLANPLNPAPIQHLALNGGGGGIRIEIDPTGKFVYGISHIMGAGTVNALHVLKVNADGTLTEPAAGSPVLPTLPPGALPQGIAVL
jgi:6-phosphogluconolactonase (cycloisomerase 2 family)